MLQHQNQLNINSCDKSATRKMNELQQNESHGLSYDDTSF